MFPKKLKWILLSDPEIKPQRVLLKKDMNPLKAVCLVFIQTGMTECSPSAEDCVDLSVEAELKVKCVVFVDYSATPEIKCEQLR